MSNQVTLKQIIDDVLNENYPEDCTQTVYDNREKTLEADRRNLYRKIDKLFKRLGLSKDVLKDGERSIIYYEEDIPMMKILISQLHSGKGIISDFVNKRKGNCQFSSNEVREFLYALQAELEKDDTLDKESLGYLINYFTNIFSYSPLRSLEICHATIDALARQLHDLPCDDQSTYLGKVEHILKKEYALRTAEAAQEIVRIADREKYRKEYYYETDPAIRLYYTQRDERILEAIQEDDDLRQYIEKKFGMKAEMLFNYATLG